MRPFNEVHDMFSGDWRKHMLNQASVKRPANAGTVNLLFY